MKVFTLSAQMQMPFDITIIHVNLTRQFRGGERQTLLLLENILADHPNIHQVLVANPKGRLFQDAQSLEKVDLIPSNSQLIGHNRVAAKSNTIVHAHEARAVHWAYLHWLLNKTPYIITRRVQDPIKTKWFNQKTYASAAACVAISHWISTHIESLGIKPILIPSSYDSKIKALPASKPALNNFYTTKLVQLGALVDSHKGQSTSIRALALLPKTYHLTIIGDGPDLTLLRAIATQANVSDRVLFKPWDDEAIEKLSDYDVFLMPSNHEGLGSIALDAMRANIPIIASHVGGLTDLIHDGTTGLTVEPGKPSELACAVRAVAEQPDLCIKLARNAAQNVKQYSPEIMTQRYVDIYKSINHRDT